MIPVGRGKGGKIRTPIEGSVTDTGVQYLCQAIPQVQAEDVWMNGVTGDHYTVKAAQVKEAFRGVPMTLICTLDLVTPGDIADTLMPDSYTAPSWSDVTDTGDASAITVTVEEDIDIEYQNFDPTGGDTYVDMNDVTPVFDIFSSAASMAAEEAALLSVTATINDNGSLWTVESATQLTLYVSLEDIVALGVGEHYYRTRFTYDGTAYDIEYGDLTIEEA